MRVSFREISENKEFFTLKNVFYYKLTKNKFIFTRKNSTSQEFLDLTDFYIVEHEYIQSEKNIVIISLVKK